ncbi:MAG: hypothetical protein M1833_004420 [Piccolia ochrophora]|nr:MAG: hypothetical protein M1833_004420 [Piccolia ochrophora]
MDPAAITARERHRTSKLRPSRTLNPFQRRLRDSPYAQALAAPPFEPCENPRSGVSWLLPKAVRITREHSDDPEVSGLLEGPLQPDHLSGGGPSKRVQPSTAAPSPATGHGMFTLARLDVLRLDQEKSKKAQLGRMVPFKWKERGRVRAADLVWRDDMDQLVAELVRKRVIHEVEYLMRRKKGYLTSCDTNDELRAKKQVGSVLWVGPTLGDIELASCLRETSEDEKPRMDGGLGPCHKTFHAETRWSLQEPVFNMLDLLGREEAQRVKLKLDANGLRGDIVTVKSKRNTLALQMWLWKLQCLLGKLPMT